MTKMKNFAVICLTAVLFAGMVIDPAVAGCVAYADTMPGSATETQIAEQQEDSVQNTDSSIDDTDKASADAAEEAVGGENEKPGNEASGGNEDQESGTETQGGDNENQGSETQDPTLIYVDNKPYTGAYLDSDSRIYTVEDGKKGAAVTGVIDSYYDPAAGMIVLSAEKVYVNGSVYGGAYYEDGSGIMCALTDGSRGQLAEGMIPAGTEYFDTAEGTVRALARNTVYSRGKIYNGYYFDKSGMMYRVSDKLFKPINGTLSKGKEYYSYKNGILKMSKSIVYVAGKKYSGYYYNSAGTMYKVSKGSAKLVSYSVSKGSKYYSYNSNKTYKLSRSTVYIKGKKYSGFYLNSVGKMYTVSKGKAVLTRGTMAKGKKFYSYKKGTMLKVTRNKIYVSGKLYTGYYMTSTKRMYKSKSGNGKAFTGTLKKGTKYYSYNSAKTLKLSKKTVFVSGKSANVWAKVNGTWCYYNSSGKQTVKSNVMYKAWKKINSKSSSTKYFMVVDTNNTKTMIFKGSKGKWVPYKLWSCTTGSSATPTVKGTFTVKNKGYSFGSGYTCYYYTQFYNDYLFHSILYNQGTFRVQDGRLGQKLSHGCVRLNINNAKWIYKNIPRKTKVYIY